MKASFNVPKELFEQTKQLVRKHGLYFVHNPFEMWNDYRFHIEGSVKQYNAFNREFYEAEATLEKQQTKTFFERIKSWF